MGRHSRPRPPSRIRFAYKSRVQLPLAQLFDQQARKLFTVVGVVMIAIAVAAVSLDSPAPHVFAKRLPDELVRAQGSFTLPCGHTNETAAAPGFRVPVAEVLRTAVEKKIDRVREDTAVEKKIDRVREDTAVEKKIDTAPPRPQREGRHHVREDHSSSEQQSEHRGKSADKHKAKDSKQRLRGWLDGHRDLPGRKWVRGDSADKPKARDKGQVARDDSGSGSDGDAVRESEPKDTDSE